MSGMEAFELEKYRIKMKMELKMEVENARSMANKEVEL